MPEEILDAAPISQPVPAMQFDFESFPSRPEGFLPLGSRGLLIEAELLKEMKNQASLAKPDIILENCSETEAKERHIDAHGLELLKNNVITSEQSCVSAS